MKFINYVQAGLAMTYDPKFREQTNTAISGIAIAKIVFVGLGILQSARMISLIASKALGPFGILFHAAMILTWFDLARVYANAQDMIEHKDGVFDRVMQAAKNIRDGSTSAAFANKLLKDTAILHYVKPLLVSLLEMEADEPAPRHL